MNAGTKLVYVSTNVLLLENHPLWALGGSSFPPFPPSSLSYILPFLPTSIPYALPKVGQLGSNILAPRQRPGRTSGNMNGMKEKASNWRESVAVFVLIYF